MRLGQKLEFRFDIDPGIDPDEVLIPTMILQPFVENAIWHGISPKKGSGLIEIRFCLEQERLLCEVIDDGVGRAYHEGRRSGQHESKALSITRRRLAILSQEQRKKAEFEIHDLFDEAGKPAGTKVSLRLPLID